MNELNGNLKLNVKNLKNLNRNNGFYLKKKLNSRVLWICAFFGGFWKDLDSFYFIRNPKQNRIRNPNCNPIRDQFFTRGYRFGF